MKLVEQVSGYNEPKPPKMPFIIRALSSWPSVSESKYQLPKFGNAQKAKFKDSFSALKCLSNLDFHFVISLLPLVLLGFIWWEKLSEKLLGS